MKEPEAPPRELLASMRGALLNVAPVEAHLVLQLSVEVLLGHVEPTDRAVRDMCNEMLTGEERHALSAQVGNSGWKTLYESSLAKHRPKARVVLLSQHFLQATKPAGYAPEEWWRDERLGRMRSLLGKIVALARGFHAAG